MPKSEPKSEVYRIQLSYANRLSGTFYDSQHQIDLPQFLDPTRTWQVAVESFVLNQTAGTVTPYRVHIPQLTQGTCYSTTSQGSSDVVLENFGALYCGRVNSNSIGIKVADLSIFRSHQWQVRLTTLNDVTLTALAATEWSLALVIYEKM
jgi:hypothetical protein